MIDDTFCPISRLLLVSSRNETEDTMETLAAYLIAEHIAEMRREADAVRLARSASSERTRTTWRRQTGNAVRRLSAALASVAAQLDPAPRRTSYGRE